MSEKTLEQFAKDAAATLGALEDHAVALEIAATENRKLIDYFHTQLYAVAKAAGLDVIPVAPRSGGGGK